MLVDPSNQTAKKHPRKAQLTNENDQVFYSTTLSFAFVNLKPIVPGHVLVSPLRRVCRFNDMTADETSDLFLTVRRVTKMVERVYGATGLNVSVQDGSDAGQSVPHVHAHVLPRKTGDLDEKGGMDMIYTMMEGKEGNIGRQLWEEMDARRAKLASRDPIESESRKARSSEDMAAEAIHLRNEMEKENLV